MLEACNTLRYHDKSVHGVGVSQTASCLWLFLQTRYGTLIGSCDGRRMLVLEETEILLEQRVGINAGINTARLYQKPVENDKELPDR